MTSFSEKTLNAIDKAREKPRHVRHAIALIGAGAFTFVLFLIWAFVLLPFRFDTVAETDGGKSNSPLSSLGAQIGSAVDSLKASLGNINWQNSYRDIKSGVQSQNNE